MTPCWLCTVCIQVFSSKSPCENINKKNIRNTKVIYIHGESLILLLDTWHGQKKHGHQTGLWVCLDFTLPLSNVQEINKLGVWNKRGGWENSPNLINGDCWVRLERVAKNRIINKREVPSIQISRVRISLNIQLWK